MQLFNGEFNLQMQSNSNWLIINKFLIWCEITKPLSGSVVQFVFNPGNKLIGYSTEVRSFGDVLPDETVHILISSTFPRMVRFTKIERNFQFFRYFLSLLTHATKKGSINRIVNKRDIFFITIIC